MQLETMYSHVDGPVATVVLNRPEVLNCANEQWARDLNTLADDLATLEQLRVVVVRGAGRAFCSGIDLTALAAGETSMNFFRNWESALRKLETLDPVVVAAIQSHCIGGGLQVALACDLRIARADARFGVTAVKEGIIPGIGMWRHAQTAYEWGLVDWVVDDAGFETTIVDVVARLQQMAATSTRLTKKLTNMACDTSFADFVQTYVEYQRLATSSPEHQQAMREHRAKRTQRAARA
jgi:enoyl-CoA hydratase/carnithine racemase